MATIDEVKKAYADLSDEDKEAFKQSLNDRVDESVAAQEVDSDTVDSQTAKDRIDEAVGEEKHEEAVEQVHEEVQEEKHEEHDAEIEELKQIVADLKATVEGLKREPQPAPKETSDELERLTAKYSN